MDVSVIIVNYNTCNVTKQCLDSIFSQTSGVEFEVILVDNASTDGSIEAFSNDKRILFIESNDNLGFGKANNLGAKRANGKYLFLLNSDTILLNNAIKMFFDYHEMLSPKVAVLGSLLKEPNGITIGNSYGVFPSLLGTIKTIFSIYTDRPLKQHEIERKHEGEISFYVDYVIGADLFIRKKVVDKIGLFDPDFFMYFEETELQYRLKKNGYFAKIFVKPNIIHLECASTNKNKNKYNYNQKFLFFSSMNLYFYKTNNYLVYLLYKVIMLMFIPVILKRQNSFVQNIKMLRLFL